MASGVSANKMELLQTADAVAHEKGIGREQVFEAMEGALERAARSHYGRDNDIRAHIDPKTGEMRVWRVLTIVDDVEDSNLEITVGDAKAYTADAAVGKEIEIDLPPISYGRIGTQAGKQVITQRVREAERERQYEEFKDRVGDIIGGPVKRVEYGNVVIDLGQGEAVIRHNELIPREVFRPGDRIRAYIKDVRREQKGPQIILSRTAPEFMAKLFAQEVPEVYEGTVEIRAVARDPGSRAKIAVYSKDTSIDPVGACVGMRGARVQAVVNELQGEKVDIVPWMEDELTFICNALAPAEVSRVVLDEDNHSIEVIVPDEKLSLAIGRRGQNVRLATHLTGWNIDIFSETDASAKRQAEFTERTQLFMTAIDVDETIAQLLATEGFASVEELAYVVIDEITAIEGFDEETAEEIQNRAKDYIDQQNVAFEEQRKKLGVEDALAAIEGITPAMLVALGEKNVKTLDDFAGCVTDDLMGWFEIVERKKVRQEGLLDSFDLAPQEAEDMIMAARLALGWVSEEDLAKLKEEARLKEEAAIAEAEAQKAATNNSDTLDIDSVFSEPTKTPPDTPPSASPPSASPPSASPPSASPPSPSETKSSI